MVLKQKGKPEKGKKSVRGAPREFSDHREFPDGPIEVAESDLSDSERSEEEESSTEESVTVIKKPTAPKTSSSPANNSNSTSAMNRREREAIQKEQARQHYIKMKEKEDGARLALVRKQREEAAAAHAEALRAKEALKKR